MGFNLWLWKLWLMDWWKCMFVESRFSGRLVSVF